MTTDPFATPEPRYEVRLEPSVPVPMRDGVLLSTDLYMPVGAGEPLPTVLVRTPYNKNRGRAETSENWFFAGQGYVVAVQDMRGKFESEGEYTVSAADREDGYDAVDWLAKQPWSNGRVGTYGCSYLGENQLQMAATRHPSHTCAIPQASSGGMTLFAMRTGGAVALIDGFNWFRRAGSKVHPRYNLRADRDQLLRALPLFPLGPQQPEIDERAACWHLPVVDILRHAGGPATDFEEFVSHDVGDPYWKRHNYITEEDRFDVPCLFLDSWYDYGPGDTLRVRELFQRNAESDRARDNQFVVIGPGTHCGYERYSEQTIVGQRDVGDARFPFRQLYLRWFDHWLKGEANGVLDEPKVRYYVMGRGEWRAADAWPLPATQFTPYYLRSGGRANSRFGDGALSTEAPGDEPADQYVYDPKTPVPSCGGPSGVGAAGSGAADQAEVECRYDVLVYSTPPLEQGVEVTGPLEVVLYVSSSARDTDFTAKLVDVYPDGTAFNVQEGILRARFREGFQARAWMEPGGVYEVRIDLQATSNFFAPGHQIRLEVSSSNFPHFDRNLNTGGNNWDETEWVVAENTVHHSAEYPSHVLLPVVAAE